MVMMATEISGVRISGYLATPSTSRATRSMQGFFINGRPVRSKVLTAAVDEAYKGRLMVGRQPIYYIMLNLHPSQIDVNVHPSKLEVKFSREREVFLAVRNAVTAVLDGLDMQKSKEFYQKKRLEAEEAKATLSGYGNADITVNKDYSTSYSAEPVKKVASSGCFGYGYFSSSANNDKKDEPAVESAASANTSVANTSASNTPPAESRPVREHRPLPTAGYLYSPIEPDLPVYQEVIADFDKSSGCDASDNEESVICDDIDLKIIGELFHTYILAESNNSMWLIDKHAAHERQIYNQLKTSGIESMAQYLFTPKMVVLSRIEKQAVLDNESLFRDIGFDTGDFGGLSIVVRSAPNYIEPEDIPAVLSELAGKIIEHKSADVDLFDALLKSVACKSAIKAGMNSDIRELVKIARAVLTSADLKSCPHGRPTAIELTKQQIEKLFKRIV
jgi:DNA mismatch repair protein MutL